MPTETNEASGDGIDWQSEVTDIEMSLADRLEETYQKRFYEPAVVAWSDIRTRIGLILLAVYITMALIAVFHLWHPPEVGQGPRLLMAFQNWKYPLGTTNSGVGVLALIIESTPFILKMVFAGGVWATTMAVAIATISGYKGGRVDSVLMAISDFFMSIPGLPLVIIIALAITPESPLLTGVVLTINYWGGVARSLRSQVLSIRENEYVEASRAMGTGTFRLIWKDIMPNIMPYVLIQFVYAARYTIFASIGLYFLGVLPYSTQNWGVTLNYAYKSGALFSLNAAHWLVGPMAAIVGLTLALTLFSQGLDRVFNPRVRTRLTGKSETDSIDTEETRTEETRTQI
jgi:peptide/nickel transport system permease protein